MFLQVALLKGDSFDAVYIRFDEVIRPLEFNTIHIELITYYRFHSFQVFQDLVVFHPFF